METYISVEQARDLLNAPSGSRPRIYALLTLPGAKWPQSVKITSHYYLDKYLSEGELTEVRTTDNSLADYIRRAP